MTAVTDRTLDFDRCYRALGSRDARFDGWFVVAVRSTGIYCRPSCPAIVPRRENVQFLRTAAAAQRSGFRACKRCRPDASPGSPEWSSRADVVGRAMRLIADGALDRDDVDGLARRLGYSRRQLQRHLVAVLGAGPLALARAQRAQTARLLIESTDLPLGQVGFAAGFGSTRQFNATVREVFACTPGELRARARGVPAASPGGLTVRLPARQPFDGTALLEFLGARALPGVEHYADGVFRRTLRLPHGTGVVALEAVTGGLRCRLRLEDLRDLAPAIGRCRRLGDLDADAPGIAEALTPDPVVGALVADTPGRRVPGAVDGAELAVRAVLGQQVTVAAGTALSGTLAAAVAETTVVADPHVSLLFPTPAAVRSAAEVLRMPERRRATVRRLAEALERGEPLLDGGGDPRGAVDAVRAIDGIGPWTAGYIAMRALADPDAYPTGDAAVRRALTARGIDGAPAQAAAAERWRPWRAYAVMQLWADPTRGAERP
ncbi:MAG: helix-turn-helix domain-containing protein [Actinobacteria bacterium]|nr:helix-turn-helix domain-containing protein [Actinomycetota bacterium]